MKNSNLSPSKFALAGLFAFLFLTALASQAVAQSTFTWTGGGGNSSWSTGGNWGGSAPSSPQAILNFAGSTQTTSNNNFGNWSAGYRIFFNSGSGAFTLTGNAIKFYDYGGTQALIENDSSNLQTVSFTIAVGNSYGMSLYANTGDLLFNGPALYLDGNSTLTTNTNSGRTITISNPIQNAGGNLYVTGAGTTILTGNNTYTGTTNINSGKLQLGDGTTGHDGSIAGTSIVNNANLTYNLSAAGTYSGVISGTGSVTKIGNSALTLSGAGANTFAGATTVSGGATSYLYLSKTDGVNSIAGNMTIGVGSSAAFVQLMASNQIADTSIVSLDGNATNARGVFRLNGFNETIGGLSSVITGGGVVDNNSTTNSTLTLNVASGSESFSGQIRNQNTGTLAIVKTGAGTQVISSLSPVGNNTYTGGTQINGGILQVGSAQALSNAGNISFGGGTLQYSANGTGTDYSARFKNSASAITLDTNGQTITLAGIIDSTNTGGLTKNGTGKLVLSGAEAYTGNTTISGGTLQIGNGTTTGSLSSSSGIINNGILVFNRSNTVTAGTDFSGSPISGSGSIVQNGSGKLLLWSGNTFTGGVTINSGTLGIWEGSGLGALPGSPTTQLTFGGNSTLQFQQTPTALPLNANRRIAINPGVTATIDTQGYNPSIAGIISGASGALAKNGSGTLTLYGSNTYGGGTSVSAGTLTLGSSSALGSATGALAVSAATLNLNAYSATVGALSSTGGIFTGFSLGGGGNVLAASSASLSGTTYIGINPTSVTGTGTSNLITSSGGGLTGTFQFAGAQTLSVPVNSLIVKNGSGSFYQVTLNNTATAEQAIVSSDVPSKVLSVMPLGASIMAGSSAQTPYSGGGFHTEMYQNLVNDGRFTPNFVGSSTNLQANSPTSPNILTSAGQTNNEGHPGYTTSQILNNLNASDGSIGNNGGFWLSANNTATSGANSPNYIPLNVGGNDFTTTNYVDNLAINRYDAIISQVSTLRPGVDTLATNLMYRSDGGGSVFNLANTYFNPYVQGVVYNHVMAGQNVQFVDLYTLITPGNSTYPANPYMSSDGIHPNQAGYNLMGDIFYNSTVYGAAYWTGAQGDNWSTLNGASTNWAMDSARTTDRQALLTNATANTYSYADVYFNGNSSPLATTLGDDTTVRSLNFAAGATGSVTVGGNNTLSIGSGGITVQQGTGAHTVSANIALAADQTWGNVSSNLLTVSGVVSGSGNLTIVGSYTVYTGDNSTSITPTTVTGTGAIVLSGNNTYTGTTTVTSGTLILNGTNSSSGVSVADGATIGGSGRIAGTISGAGRVSPGNSPGILTANQISPTGGLDFAFEFTATGGPAYGNAAASVNDVLRLNNAATPFVADLTGSNAVDIYLNLTTVSAGNTFQGGFFTDKSVTFLSSINSAVFAYYVKGNGGGAHAYNGFTYYTLAEYDAGLSINLSTVQVGSAAFADGTVTDGYISQLNVVPEPATWALLAASLAALPVFRRRKSD